MNRIGESLGEAKKEAPDAIADARAVAEER
jgi:hypothetical protein